MKRAEILIRLVALNKSEQLQPIDDVLAGITHSDLIGLTETFRVLASHANDAPKETANRDEVIAPLYVIVRDNDKKTFNIEGPVISDESWTKAVIQAKHKGRNVNCDTAERNTETRDLLIKETEKRLGYQYTDDPVL